MRGSRRAVAALAIVVLLTLALAACGGDEDSTTGTETSAGQALAPAGRPDTTGEKKGSPGQGSGKAGQPSGDGSAPAAGKVDAPPLKVTGGGSEQARVKGGDNSIQEYGEEDEDGLAEAAEAVHAFYVARAEEDWVTACSYLAEMLRGQLLQLASRSEQGGKVECPAVLAALTPPLPASVRRESTIVDALSLRVEEGRSFLIYRGERGTVYAMPLEDSDGAWKLTLLSPTPLG